MSVEWKKSHQSSFFLKDTSRGSCGLCCLLVLSTMPRQWDKKEGKIRWNDQGEKYFSGWANDPPTNSKALTLEKARKEDSSENGKDC